MKKIPFFFLLFPFLASAQVGITPPSKTYKTYDTTFLGWNAKVKFDPLDTAAKEGMIYFPGSGEVGNDPDKLLLYNMFNFIDVQKTWDGSVELGNGTHYPIYIALQPPSQSVITGPNIKLRIDAILARYPIKRNAFYLTGISAGGFAAWSFVTCQPTPGDFSYGDLVTAIMCPESVKPNQQVAGTATPPYPQNVVQWIKRGKYALGFNQVNDGGRDMLNYFTKMDSAAKGRVTLYDTKYGAGDHSNFDKFYDARTTNWRTNALATLRVGPQIPDGWNTYQWLLRKGDTSLPTVAPPPVARICIDSPVINSPNSIVRVNADSSQNATSWQWVQYSGPTPAIWTSVSGTPHKSDMLVSGLYPGSYVFGLYAMNAAGQADSAKIVVTVKPIIIPAPRIVTSMQALFFGSWITIPAGSFKAALSDGTIQQ